MVFDCGCSCCELSYLQSKSTRLIEKWLVGSCSVAVVVVIVGVVVADW